jgi:hypothetical protein
MAHSSYSQDDAFTESYISTIGVDFVSIYIRSNPRVIPLIVLCQRFRTVKIDKKTVKLQIVRGWLPFHFVGDIWFL